VCVQPTKRDERVPDRCRVGVLRCSAVLDREHRHAAGGHIARDRPVEEIDVTEDVAAAVEEQHGGAGLGAFLDVPAHLDLGPVGGGSDVLGCRHVGRDRLGGASGADDGFPDGAAGGDVADRWRRGGGHCLGHRGDGLSELWIE
jgi:hypothetical protein